MYFMSLILYFYYISIPPMSKQHKSLLRRFLFKYSNFAVAKSLSYS